MNKNKHSSLKQWISIQIVKNPSRVILTGIILINIIFIMFAAGLLSILGRDYVSEHGFWAYTFYILIMIMDAGSVSNVVDLGNTDAFLVVSCIIIIIIGMIFFTGGIIGYVSNLIANFIENANTGKRPLIISRHTIILNWNTKASEIVNDMLYSKHKETVVVLVNDHREIVANEIEARIQDTIEQENRAVMDECKGMSPFETYRYYRAHSFKRKLTVIVREGDTFSNKQLMDISLDKAKAVIILNNEDETSKIQEEYGLTPNQLGNPITVKTLVLVAEITAQESSADNQKIIVEVEDPWTENLLKKVISHKENLGKCNIVPMPVNKVLGQLLSQFAIMPELNLVYSELFSNRGAAFFSAAVDEEIDQREYLEDHFHAIPLSNLDTKTGKEFFYVSDFEEEYYHTLRSRPEPFEVKLNHDYWQPKREILILGHNSKTVSLMDGFNSYRNEWNRKGNGNGEDILDITVIDDVKGLTNMNYYKDYRDYVTNVIEADIFNQEKIYNVISDFISDGSGDKGILILSDDKVSFADLDTSALTFLIYVQDVLSRKPDINKGPGTKKVDVIAEILDPKNYDVVRSYNVNNVIISNRYLSKMITQIGEKESLYEFYSDILRYDTEDSSEYDSMELYIKNVKDFFEEIPKKCSAAQLIRAVYKENKKHKASDLCVVLGIMRPNHKMVLFSSNQNDVIVELTKDDRLILFSNH